VIYVDDLLIIASKREIEHILKLCVKEFQWVMMEVGTILLYLGMQLEFLLGVVCIDMQNYISKILQEFAYRLL
jgi:hypothetical protein